MAVVGSAAPIGVRRSQGQALTRDRDKRSHAAALVCATPEQSTSRT